MVKLFERLRPLVGWLANEHIKDYRESRTRIYDAIVKTNTHINQIILTVSAASLTAIAALNKELFIPYSGLSLVTVALFIAIILLSTVNLYLASLVLDDMQKQLNINWSSLSRLNRGMEKQRFEKTRRILNATILIGFCLGLVSFLTLLGIYITGSNS